MDAEDEAECVPFAVPGLEDLEPGCEEDVIAAVAGLNKSRAPLPMEQLVVLYTKATKKHCAGVAKALCDVFCKYFKSHRKVYAQFGLAQVVAESVEDMVQSTDNSKKALEKALWLLVKFCQSGVRLMMKTEVLRNVLENTVSRVSSGDCGVVKNALFLVASVCGEDTSEFEEIFCRIADTAMDADSPQPEFAKEYFRAVSLDKSITNALFGKLVHLFLKPSYDLKNKTRALKALHRILNANSAFVYTLDDDDDVIDALTEVARGTFAEVAQHSLPSSSEVKVLNMLLSLIAKLRTKVPLLLEVEPRGPRVSVNAKEPAFDERDLFPELHVNVKGSADYTSDYKKCHCSSKCSCESVCFCGCTECQRPPVLEKKDLYTELVSTKDGQHDEHSGTDTGAAAHAFAQLKSPLLKVFDEDEQFERIIASISTDSELGTEWENVNDGKALSFAADFESGNLQSAKRVGEYDYELVLSPDTGTGGNAQWFYFSMTGMAPKENYNFKIVNMEKSRTLFNNGQRVVLFSQKLYDERKIGWIRAGTDICYYGNRYRRHGCSSALIYHTLSFSLTFKYPEDKCWVALYYPYTSSALKRYLSDRVAKHRARNVISWTAATPPAGGCDVVTLTGFASARAEIAKREYVFVIARLRPCEVQSTFLAQGLIDFLLSEGSPAATSLLRRYVFKVVPIANPGGVALGNAETDPSGADLHTAWGRRGGGAAGAVEAVEAMLAAVGPRTAFFVDLHGTCKRSNCFVSGYNALSSDVGSPLSEKVFAYLLWCARPDFFAFSDCRYENLPSTARGGGAGCGRAFVRREHGVLNSFSFSATSAGMTFGPLEGMHLNPAALLRLGEYLGEALHEYATASPSKKAGVISQIYAMYKQYYPDYAI